MELISIYKPYEGGYCRVAVKNWNDASKLFWRDGQVKLVNETGLYLVEEGEQMITIPLNEIVKIEIRGQGR